MQELLRKDVGRNQIRPTICKDYCELRGPPSILGGAGDFVGVEDHLFITCQLLLNFLDHQI